MRLFEIVQSVLPVRMSMPAVDVAPVPKKSWILLLSITSCRLIVLLFVVVPTAEIALIGRFAPAGPMSLFETVSLLLPTRLVPLAVAVLKRTLPPAVPTATVDDPRIVEFVRVSFWAPLMNRTVLVPATLLVLVFESLSELPPELRPSICTLLAPFRSTSGAARLPDVVRAPDGTICTVEYEAEPLPLALST